MIRRLSVGLVVFVLMKIVFAVPLYAEEPVPAWWVIESTKGCSLLWESAAQSSYEVSTWSFTWSGNCVNGNADGTGELNWFIDGILYATIPFTGENGVMMVDGKQSFKIPPDAVRLVLISTLDSEQQRITGVRARECGDGHEYVNVYAFVDKKLALYATPIIDEIASDAFKLAQSRCSRVTDRGLKVYIYYEGDLPQGKGYDPRISASVQYGVGGWHTWNYAKDFFFGPQEQKYQALLDERNKLKAQQALNARRAAEERANKEKLARYNVFLKKNSVVHVLRKNTLSANPFIYEGKTIAIQTTFSEMLTADRGLFEDTVVSGIPKNLFKARGTYVFLAGKVLGKIPVKTPFGGEVNMTHLRFVGAHVCANYGCSDILP